MAEGGLEDLLECQVCLEQYEENGDHIPRLLPCSHTFCESCIKQLLQQGGGNRLMCPECRNPCQAPHGIRSFPQNKDKLAMIRQKLNANKQKTTVVEKCQQHGRKLEFYCKDPRCQLPICTSCLKINHKSHDWVEIEEEGRKILLENIESVERQLQIKFNAGSKIQQMKKETERCVRDLKVKRDEIVKIFDEMIREAEECLKNQDEEMSAMDEQLAVLNGLKQHISAEPSISNVISSLEIVQGVRESLGEERTSRTYRYPVYEPGRPAVEVCGKISYRETRAEVSRDSHPLSRFGMLISATVVPVSRSIRNASELQCTVTQTINIGLNPNGIPDLSLVGAKVMLDLHDERNEERCKLNSYDLKNREFRNATLDGEKQGMTEITLGGRTALALADSEKQLIEFRDGHDLTKTIYRHSVAPSAPGRLCASASHTTLLYEDCASNPRKVQWLDCSREPPRRVQRGNITSNYNYNYISNMCAVQDGNKELLAVTNKHTMRVYEQETGELVYSNQYSPYGVTSDGIGHLYVSDLRNKCIQMFRASDGEYLGRLIKEGEQGLGNPWMIRWCQNLSSLILLHQKDDETFHVSCINVKRN